MEEHQEELTAKAKTKKNNAEKDEAQKAYADEAQKADVVYVHGFKIPLEIHPQLSACDRITFMIGTSTYSLTPSEILNMAGGAGKIRPQKSVGPIPWRAAIGIFVNNLDGGRNQQLNDMIQSSNEDTFEKNLK